MTHPRRAWSPAPLACLLALLLIPGLCLAAPAAPDAPGGDEAMGFFLAPQIKRFLRSHTSYQFGDPEQANLNPLSRLEFPLNSWWAGVNLGLKGPRTSLELELLAGLPDQDDLGVVRDSDWEDPNRPKLRTTYSETTTKLKESFTLDAKVSHGVGDKLGLPAWLDLKPLLGVRWQHFVFTGGPGMQQSMVYQGGQPTYDQWEYYSLPQDTFWFRQEYLHAYIGAQVCLDLGRLGLGRPGAGWRASLQADLAHVWGENRDRHLLRGERKTEERTQGYAWHTGLSLRAPLWDRGALVASGDYLIIRTSGEHRWTQPEEGVDETWDYGVEVWSRQMSWSLALEIDF